MKPSPSALPSRAACCRATVKDVLLLDVTPLSLGIETLGGVMTKLIQKNTTIPTKASAGLLDRRRQPVGRDHPRPPGRTRNRFRQQEPRPVQPLEGIPPAPRGMPQIEVTFDIDANGILHVSAKDKATGKENKITIKANSGLSEAEIQQMVQDAEAHAEEDKKAHELADARNQCDTMIHMVKKSLNEYGKELSDEEKGKIEEAIKEAEDSIRGNDIDAIKQKSEALGTAAQKLGEKMYAKQQAEAGAAGGDAGQDAGAAGGAKKDDGDVVDAEYTEVKDKK